MKKKPTPIVYPTTKEQEEKWGFDIHKPKGVPRAWIQDWDSASAGFGLSLERMQERHEFNIPEDLSQVTVDELFAGCAFSAKQYWQTLVRVGEERFGADKVVELVTSITAGLYDRVWQSVQNKFGSPLPLDKIAWYQDAGHMRYGPVMKPYTWFDDEKVVCTRSTCRSGPLKGMESNAKYCRASHDGALLGYMKVEPTLLCVRVPDLGDDGMGGKCVDVWTYNKAVIDGLPDSIKKQIREPVREVLRRKGARV